MSSITAESFPQDNAKLTFLGFSRKALKGPYRSVID